MTTKLKLWQWEICITLKPLAIRVSLHSFPPSLSFTSLSFVPLLLCLRRHHWIRSDLSLEHSNPTIKCDLPSVSVCVSVNVRVQDHDPHWIIHEASFFALFYSHFHSNATVLPCTTLLFPTVDCFFPCPTLLLGTNLHSDSRPVSMFHTHCHYMPHLYNAI